VHISADDPCEFGVYEIYTNNDAFDEHEKGEGFKHLFGFLEGKLEGGLTVKKFRAL
jgi:quinol monooxygenase YgiN